MSIATRKSRFPHGLRDTSSTLATTADTTLTEAQVMANSRITMGGTTKTITLPAASSVYKGIRLLIASIQASAADNKVKCAAGFNGGGASYDYVTLAALSAMIFECDGTYWYAIGASAPAAS